MMIYLNSTKSFLRKVLMFLTPRRKLHTVVLTIWLIAVLSAFLFVNNLNHPIKDFSKRFTFKSQTEKSDFLEVPQRERKIRRRPFKLTSGQIRILRRYKPFRQFFNDEEKAMIYDLLKQFDTAMKKYNIFYVMYGGTLLGSYRNHDIIPWDDDVDVFVHINDTNRLEEALSHYSPKYRYGNYNHGKFYRHDGAKFSRFPWKFPFVDVIFFNDSKYTVTETIPAYNQQLRYSKEFLYPSHLRPLGPLMLPAPRDTLRFLIQGYGASGNCSWLTYSHAVEIPIPPPRFDIRCRSLRDHYPFVLRKALPAMGENRFGVKEILVAPGGDIIESIEVNEPVDAINEDYSIKIFEKEEQRIQKYFRDRESEIIPDDYDKENMNEEDDNDDYD